jgi:hypothetical protein
MAALAALVSLGLTILVACERLTSGIRSHWSDTDYTSHPVVTMSMTDATNRGGMLHPVARTVRGASSARFYGQFADTDA